MGLTKAALTAMLDEFIETHNILACGSVQRVYWFSYNPNGGYWEYLPLRELGEQISKLFGINQPTFISRAMKILQDKCLCLKTPDWGAKRLDNFTNGTLELDTGTLREYRPDDYLTWCHTYDYNPAANECPNFDAFMSTIANGKQSRIDFLTDAMAYILYGDNRLQKIFFLVSDSPSECGETAFLRLLKMLFARKNHSLFMNTVSQVYPSMIGNPIGQIWLMGAKINLVCNMNLNLLPYCGIGLQALSESCELIGYYRFHTTGSFTNRAKTFVECTRVPEFGNTLYEMGLRLMFCRFTNKMPNAYALDSLEPEIPAIYNRIYSAYKALRERERQRSYDVIRPCCDNVEILQSLK